MNGNSYEVTEICRVPKVSDGALFDIQNVQNPYYRGLQECRWLRKAGRKWACENWVPKTIAAFKSDIFINENDQKFTKRILKFQTKFYGEEIYEATEGILHEDEEESEQLFDEILGKF